MSPGETLILCIPLLGGFTLLLYSMERQIHSGNVQRLSGLFLEFHRKLHATLVEKGILRFPGARLATSVTGWILGEFILLATVAVSMSFSLSFQVFLISAAAGSVLGGSIAFLAIRREARIRIQRIRDDLPSAAFLFSLMLEAGTGSAAAMMEVVKSLPQGPLTTELSRISRFRLLGASQTDVIDASRERVPLDDYQLFLNLIQQGDRLGIGLSAGLRELSSRMLESQNHRAEAFAQKAAVKLLFPLMVFIFPSVFLTILSPVILNLRDLLGG